MALKLQTAPTIEPITLIEAKKHLRLNSGTFGDYLTPETSIKNATWPVTPLFGIVGSGVYVLNTESLVVLGVGTCTGAATLTAKIQESDDNITYTDWVGGSFTLVNAANDDAQYEKLYTGIKSYIRVVATVAVDTVQFGCNVTIGNPVTVEDSQISSWITTARKYVEKYTNRALISQTWDWEFDSFPQDESSLVVPLPPLQSVTSITYYDTDGTSNILAASKYIVDDNELQGRIGLAYGETWPDEPLLPTNGVVIRYKAGYGDTAASVPAELKQAMLYLIGHYYEYRESDTTANLRVIQDGLHELLWFDRIVPI